MRLASAPRFTFSNRPSVQAAGSWARARSSRVARLVVVAEEGSQTTKPSGIRATRTIRRDGTRRPATLVRGWRR